MTTIIHDRSIFASKPSAGVTGTYCIGTADGECAYAPEIGKEVKSLFVTGTERAVRDAVLRSLLVGIVSAYGADEATVVIAERGRRFEESAVAAFADAGIVGEFRVCESGDEIAALVKAARAETDSHMETLAKARARNIDEYNLRGQGTMKRYFLVVSDDEGDIAEFEKDMSFIAYVGSAAGVHLIYASPDKPFSDEYAYGMHAYFVVSSKLGKECDTEALGVTESAFSLSENELMFYGGRKELARLKTINYTDEEIEAFVNYIRENEGR